VVIADGPLLARKPSGARFEEIRRDLKQGQIAIRSDILRQERAIASVETDIDRIKASLDLSDIESACKMSLSIAR
jgi:hypothetical protein